MIDRIFRRLVAGVALAFGALAAPAGAQSSVGITINGNAVNVYPAPIVQAGRVFVPLRGVFEQLGASVVYDSGQITATGNNTEIALQIGSTQATVNGQTQTIDVAPFIVGASTYVPLRFISQALGASVAYDDANRVVAISTSGGYQQQAPQGPPSFYETGYNVNEPPPPLPEYDQPPVPEPNYIWQPGCWAWSPSGYYWVPGTWVPAPQPNLLWTPGYWSFNLGSFGWHPGYWASQVGFYGGINYGGGYNGNGYQGGRWSDGAFRYNRAASNVSDSNVIRNEYVYTSVVNNFTTTRASYNGGPQGVAVRPSATQLAVEKQTHVPIMPLQKQHAEIAAQDRRLLATVNAGKPPVTVAPRPFTPETKPADLVPVTDEDKAAAEKLVVHPRVVAPVRPAVAQPVHPATAPVVRPETVKEPVHPETTKEPVRPETIATPLRPRVTASPVRPEAVTPPVVKPHVVKTPEPAVVRPPIVTPEAMPVHPPIVRPAPTVRPQVVRPVTPHPAVVHPATPKPAPHPETNPHPEPKPDHTERP
ncbi:MAG: YXWGXW repeat-containing protein [Candidatus Eremiobacteraeota bacterium]|nr:YXWGXW repeat-containing protein [Candidatus Eremiobacteraeota bacterium]